MNENQDGKSKGFYQDISRITVRGLSEIALDFNAFYKELSLRVHPALTNVAEKDLPEASDQLYAIIETTEQAANRIMDNLEAMQQEQNGIQTGLEALVAEAGLPSAAQAQAEAVLDQVKSSQDRVMKIFEEMSFQDLTGQRIKRIVTLVQAIEGTVQEMLVSLGDRFTREEPGTERKSEEEPLLKGPQKSGQGLDQSAIDDLLKSL
ncbi:MAG: protein phosphatase CheZ [Proteobacteria bacterium]|nr:protein phosphatase CheZ [Pseudomonadota bacterium]